MTPEQILKIAESLGHDNTEIINGSVELVYEHDYSTHYVRYDPERIPEQWAELLKISLDKGWMLSKDILEDDCPYILGNYDDSKRVESMNLGEAVVKAYYETIRGSDES